MKGIINHFNIQYMLYMCVCVCEYVYTHIVYTYDKESACNSGDPGLIPALGRPPGGGNSNQLQYSCLEKPMDREA